MRYFLLPQIMVIRMGEVVEACEPPPCMGALCACAGGGFAGSAGPLLEQTCFPFLEPCNNGDALCSQCYSESGCATRNAKKTPTTCKVKNNGESICEDGDSSPKGTTGR